jgi:2,3,4,5-tetrahydropyridine-2-carboxylate N-succinyltransferase
LLDAGKLRVAEPKGDAWQVNEWVKKSSCYVFLSRKWKHGKLDFEYHDKMELKDYAAKGVRVVQEHQLVTATYQAGNYDA